MDPNGLRGERRRRSFCSSCRRYLEHAHHTAGARRPLRLEDERPDFRLVSRAKLNDIHVNDDHGSEQCSHCQATMLIGPVHMFDLIRRRDRRSLPRSLNGISRLTLQVENDKSAPLN